MPDRIHDSEFLPLLSGEVKEQYSMQIFTNCCNINDRQATIGVDTILPIRVKLPDDGLPC